MVSIASFRSSSINNDVNLVNYRPVKSKIDNKAGYPLRILHTLVQIWSLMAPKKGGDGRENKLEDYKTVPFEMSSSSSAVV